PPPSLHDALPTFGHADYDISTSGGSGDGALTFTVSTGTACSIVAGKLHVLTAAGTCKITAHKAGTDDYNNTDSAEFPVTLHKANQATLAISDPADATFGHADYDIDTKSTRL